MREEGRTRNREQGTGNAEREDSAVPRSPLPVLCSAFVFFLSCSHSDSSSPPPPPPAEPFDAGVVDCTPADVDARLHGKCARLSQYALFVGAGVSQPAQGVVPYDVIAPLFSDFAVKHRAIYVPPGGKLADDPTQHWDAPVGAIGIKTFAFPRDARDATRGERLIETRLVIRAPEGFVPVTYVWTDDQSDAVRTVAGETIDVSWIDASGATHQQQYGVPDTNHCLRCHGLHGAHWLGIRTRQLDRALDYGAGPENEIDHLAKLGLLAQTPPPAAQRDHLVTPSDTAQPLAARARSYLESNCGHCHDESASAEWSGLYLDWENQDAARLGVCKQPSSAGDTGGLFFDVVPGHPEKSVMVYRVSLQDSAYRMPEGSRLADPTGVQILTQWIQAMPAQDCGQP